MNKNKFELLKVFKRLREIKNEIKEHYEPYDNIYTNFDKILEAVDEINDYLKNKHRNFNITESEIEGFDEHLEALKMIPCLTKYRKKQSRKND